MLVSVSGSLDIFEACGCFFCSWKGLVSWTGFFISGSWCGLARWGARESRGSWQGATRGSFVRSWLVSCQPEHFTVSDTEMLKLLCFRMITLDMDLSMLARRLPLLQAMFFPDPTFASWLAVGDALRWIHHATFTSRLDMRDTQLRLLDIQRCYISSHPGLVFLLHPWKLMAGT